MTYDASAYVADEEYRKAVQGRMRLLFSMLPDAIDVPIKSVHAFRVPATDGGAAVKVVHRHEADAYLQELDDLVQECYVHREGAPRVTVQVSFTAGVSATVDHLVEAAYTMLVQVEDGLLEHDEDGNENQVANVWDAQVDRVAVNNIEVYTP